MERQYFIKNAMYEHRFWLSVLRDHARFIHSSLAHNERAIAQKANFFIQSSNSLIDQSKLPLREADILNLTQQAYNFANDIREFKLQILSRHLMEKIDIDLPPTFINHMINEVEEYIRILQCIMTNQLLQCHPVHHHLLWLLDGVGHADTIACSLDPVEQKLIKESKEFSKTFKDFYLKAVEMSGYIRTCITKFPALRRFNSQVEHEMILFMKFLKELEKLDVNKKALGTLMPLMLDHMFREECYYLTKLSQVSEINKPNCDATQTCEY